MAGNNLDVEMWTPRQLLEPHVVARKNKMSGIEMSEAFIGAWEGWWFNHVWINGWNQSELTGVFLSAPRYDWCAPLSHPSSHMLVNHGPSQRAPKKNTSHGNEVLPQDTTHLTQKPCYQRGSPCQDPAGNRTTRRPPDDRKETQTAVVWSCFPFIRSGRNHLARHSERGKKTRQTEEEVGRQHQGMDRPGVRKVPEGNENRGKWRKLVAKSSVVSQRPSRLRDWWW